MVDRVGEETEATNLVDVCSSHLEAELVVDLEIMSMSKSDGVAGDHLGVLAMVSNDHEGGNPVHAEVSVSDGGSNGSGLLQLVKGHPESSVLAFEPAGLKDHLGEALGLKISTDSHTKVKVSVTGRPLRVKSVRGFGKVESEIVPESEVHSSALDSLVDEDRTDPGVPGDTVNDLTTQRQSLVAVVEIG